MKLTIILFLNLLCFLTFVTASQLQDTADQSAKAPNSENDKIDAASFVGPNDVHNLNSKDRNFESQDQKKSSLRQMTNVETSASCKGTYCSESGICHDPHIGGFDCCPSNFGFDCAWPKRCTECTTKTPTPGGFYYDCPGRYPGRNPHCALFPSKP